jgi:hypothetical protein
MIPIPHPITSLLRSHSIQKELRLSAETRAQMDYPIAIDNQSVAWHAWGNPDWPTTYLIDKNGHVRYWWYGELNWQNNGSEKYLRDHTNADQRVCRRVIQSSDESARGSWKSESMRRAWTKTASSGPTDQPNAWTEIGAQQNG